jgi:hypothetical protein
MKRSGDPKSSIRFPVSLRLKYELSALARKIASLKNISRKGAKENRKAQSRTPRRRNRIDTFEPDAYFLNVSTLGN